MGVGMPPAVKASRRPEQIALAWRAQKLSSDSQRWPRLLVVSESPPSSTQGFGVTLATLLQDWPVERRFVLYREARFRDEQTPTKHMSHAPMPGSLPWHGLVFALGRRPEWMGRYSRRWLLQQLSGWRPDVIYSFFYHGSIPRYVLWLSQEFNCPYLVHIGDEGSSLDSRPSSSLGQIYRRAAGRIAISEVMKEEYERRFDTPFHVLHNGAAPELFDQPSLPSKTREGLVIRYVGSLLREQQWEAIEDIVEAVKRFNGNGRRARFEIYCGEWTARYARELADGVNVVHAGFAPKPDVYRILQTADLLVLPITFGPARQVYRLSMPTKLCEYLASGSNTLVYGPPETAAVQLCRQHGLAWVHSERDVEALVGRLEELEAEPTACRRKAAADREFARRNLSASAMADRFRRLVVGAARSATPRPADAKRVGARAQAAKREGF